MRWLVAVTLLGITAAAFGEIHVDRASVSVERRGARDWGVLDAQVSGPIEADIDAVASVIQNYAAYTQMFPRIHEAATSSSGSDVLLAETVVVGALGMKYVNRFTLRVRAQPTSAGFRLAWAQESTDGTIDGLEGEWLLERRGTSEKPVTWVTYRTRSVVLLTTFGEDILLRMVLGGETKDVVEAVRRVVSRSSH